MHAPSAERAHTERCRATVGSASRAGRRPPRAALPQGLDGVFWAPQYNLEMQGYAVGDYGTIVKITNAEAPRPEDWDITTIPDPDLKPVYSYSRARGAFLGVSVEGSVIAPRDEVNEKFYGAGGNARSVVLGASALVLLVYLRATTQDCDLSSYS